jgi:putative flippase GtrA
MNLSRPTIFRFLKYGAVGGSTFGLDLLLMAGFLKLGMSYPLATYTAFLIAVSINYTLSRQLVFRGTRRSVEVGYINMVLAAALGAFLTMSLTMGVVKVTDLNALAARLPVAVMIGIGNYLFNLYVNFRVAGRHY